MLLLLLSAALASDPSPLTYGERVAGVGWRQAVMQRSWQHATTDTERARVLEYSQRLLEQILVDELLPEWVGTPWAYAGTASRPGGAEGIACGYLVSTVLRDAGIEVERARLAQQPSEYIVRTLAPPEHIWRFRERPVAEVLDRVALEGEGVYVVGLDTHVVFLVHRGDAFSVCHSSKTGPRQVRCEPAAESWSFTHSRYHVVGPALGEDVVRRWLEGEPVTTDAWTPPPGWVPRTVE